MSSETVYFKANAGVKDIVGRGLIYDDNIAIIELVKNAKDARSSDVSIKFQNETKISDNSAVIISDHGEGMTYEEIENKWLNIAYSEKKGKQLDKETAYAGNKGVGRFSCDRLGKELVLYTKSSGGDYLKLPINWEDFENKAQQDEISTIPIECLIMNKSDFLKEIDDKDFKHGTVLKIKKLRSEWSARKLKRLVGELEKFSSSIDAKFDVFIYSDTRDKEGYLEEKLNKKINNNILNKLSFKTTHIKSSIDKSGKMIETALYYEGDEIYTYSAINPYENLKNVSIEVHFLDTLAKSYFTKKVGVSANEYGSIFLFYNGFRVSPYGNAKNDWLSLDQRKSQGTARYLGTREVFGRIDIKDDDGIFSVITSREGLAHNKAFYDLAAFDVDDKTVLKSGKESYGYATTIIRQLEQFVVGGLNWNRLFDRLAPDNSNKVITELDVKREPERYAMREISSDNVEEACEKILKSDFEISDFKINKELIISITETTNAKYNQFVNDFVEKTNSKSIKDLSSSEKGALKKIVKEEQAKTRAAKDERDYAEDKREKAEKIAETEKQRANLFEGMVSAEATLDALITHIMKQISGGIEKDVRSILHDYYKNPDEVTKEELISILEDVVIDITTIKESATMASKASFNLKVSKIKEDLFWFLENYIDKIASRDKKWGLKIHFSNPKQEKKIHSFKPADICILFVNFFDNARKAEAKNIWITVSEKKIIIQDDGNGFDLKTYDQNDFFRKGISTTSGGSGLGLYHCKEIANKLNAKISIENRKKTKGSEITLDFK